MKNYLLWMLTAILCCGPLMAQAQEEEKFLVVEGDFYNVVRQPGKTAIVTFDYDQAKLANLSTGEVRDETLISFLKNNDEKAYNNWEDYKSEGKDEFIERWNDAKKKCIKLMDGEVADYHINIHADAFDTGNAGAATWSWNKRSGGIMITGTLTITDASGKSVCTMKINRYRGTSTRNFDFKFPNFHRRVVLFHKSLAKDLLELVL